jgi:serine O-acetyltransferase
MSKDDFIKKIHQKHQLKVMFPSSSSINKLMTKLLLLLFPEQNTLSIEHNKQISEAFDEIELELKNLLESIPEKWKNTPLETSTQFMTELPKVYEMLLEDIQAALNGDPAAVNELEIIRAYPSFYGVAFYRFAHVLHQLNVPLIPRIITEYAHSKTGIDIHPGAQIGSSFYIDHGTGVVIGGTSIIGKNVKIYQGVTLGALSVSKDMAQTKRHPSIEDNVVIYSGTTILGGETTIGANSVVGGNVWLTKSIPAYSKVYNQSATIIKEGQTIS